MPKVALVKVNELEVYDSGFERIIDSITEWEIVSEDELRLLKGYYQRTNLSNHILVLEYVDNQRERIVFAVKAQLEYIKKEKEKEEVAKKIKAEKALARKHKLDQKKIEDKKKLLEQLKKELGE